jgi:hypothetical protein
VRSPGHGFFMDSGIYAGSGTLKKVIKFQSTLFF